MRTGRGGERRERGRGRRRAEESKREQVWALLPKYSTLRLTIHGCWEQQSLDSVIADVQSVKAAVLRAGDELPSNYLYYCNNTK